MLANEETVRECYCSLLVVYQVGSYLVLHVFFLVPASIQQTSSDPELQWLPTLYKACAWH